MKAAPDLILGKLEASFQPPLPSPLVSHVSQWEAETVRTFKSEKCASERFTAVKLADTLVNPCRKAFQNKSHVFLLEMSLSFFQSDGWINTM